VPYKVVRSVFEYVVRVSLKSFCICKPQRLLLHLERVFNLISKLQNLNPARAINATSTARRFGDSIGTLLQELSERARVSCRRR
jgi:hypothetical protein